MTSYYGIVENNDDSLHEDTLKLGRCQVRVFGKHTDNKSEENDTEYLPTNELPWFDVLFPTTTSGNINSHDTHFIKNGSIVRISYMDEYEQFGIIEGILIRQASQLPDFEKGFCDPNKEFPKEDNLNKSPFFPEGTGEIDEKIQAKIDGVETSTLGFSEPATKYAPKYTQNKVISSKHHIIELDDTDGKERINIYHKSGSFIEIHPNGDIVEKVKSSKYKIILSDSNELVKGAYNLEVTGDINIKTAANTTIDSGANCTIKCGADSLIDTGANCTIKSPNTILTGGKVTIAGAVAPGDGALCCLKNCIFSGAVHTGQTSSGA